MRVPSAAGCNVVLDFADLPAQFAALMRWAGFEARGAYALPKVRSDTTRMDWGRRLEGTAGSAPSRPTRRSCGGYGFTVPKLHREMFDAETLAFVRRRS
jgi:hypothetical protein